MSRERTERRSRAKSKALRDNDGLNAAVQGYRAPDDLWQEVAIRAYQEINTPLSLGLASCIIHGDYAPVAELKLDPSRYVSFDEFQKDWVASELLRKFSGLPGFGPEARKRAALDRAAEAERRCSETNLRLRRWNMGFEENPRAMAVLRRAKRKISYVLGEYSLSDHISLCRWGPGSDALNKRPYVAPYHKFRGQLSATRGVMPFLAVLTERSKPWSTWLSRREDSGTFSPLITIFPGNGALTVPKTALTDRFICVEPAVNVYVQLGLGQLIRRKLRKVGLDLSSQEKNRWFALEGSFTDLWATIDLSSASDTIARQLIQILFDSPDLQPWLKVMEACRSPFTNYGTPRRPDVRLNHKFSSMGNGFTFELETLVFWALVSSATEEEGGKCAAVYGDDIIVTKHEYPAAVEALEWFGFEVNTRKSFHSGFFRESCGMNAWNGYEAVSFRLEKLETLAHVYSLHNGLRRCGLHKTASYVLRRIPGFLRFKGPSGAGDGVLHDPEYTNWNARPHGLVDQWFFWGVRLKALTWVAREQRVLWLEPALLHSLATMAPQSDHGVYTGNRWGSEGVVTLTDGEWSVGELLVDRLIAGLQVDDVLNV